MRRSKRRNRINGDQILTRDNLLDAIRLDRHWDKGLIEGCSEQDIKELQSHIGQKLPNSYLDVMRIIGRRAGDNFDMEGRVFCYPGIKNLTTKVRQQGFGENSSLALPENAFVCYEGTGGEAYLFYLLEAGVNDPQLVWWDMETPDRFDTDLESIWDFLEGQIQPDKAKN